jgi:branched-chain amino acid transport system ATP-binding protein
MSSPGPDSAAGTDHVGVDEADRHVVVDGLTTGYDNYEVLHDVSMRSHDDVTCVFGPNGSGKSTLLKSIAGTLPVWSGSVHFGDRDITDYSSHGTVRAGIATLPQDGGIFDALSVRENLLLGAHTVNDSSTVRERLEDVYDSFPALADKRAEDAESLSGGQQMMLGFGIAMMSGAELFLLDEPTAGLAPSLVGDVLDMIRKLVDRGATIVLVEQNVTAGLTIADHVYILAQGEVQFDGGPESLSEEDELIELYLGID